MMIDIEDKRYDKRVREMFKLLKAQFPGSSDHVIIEVCKRECAKAQEIIDEAMNGPTNK